MFVLTNFYFIYFIESTPNHFLVQVIHRGIVQQEYHLPLAGVVAALPISGGPTPSPSRRRRVRANMAANEEISIASRPATSLNSASGSASSVMDLISELQQGNACFICTHEFSFAERVVCPGCSNFLCLHCYANMDRAAMDMGRNVNCPFCRRRLHSNAADDVFDISG